MASENPSFVDTENTNGSRDVQSSCSDDATCLHFEADTPHSADGNNHNDSTNTQQRQNSRTDGDPNSNSKGNKENPVADSDALQQVKVEANGSIPADSVDGATEIDARTKIDCENGGVRANGLKGAALNGSTASSALRQRAANGALPMAKMDGGACENGTASGGAGAGGGNGGGASAASAAWGPGEAGRMLRNAVGVGVVFMVHFTATLGVTHLQSSVNKERGLGTQALAAQYAGLVLSSLLLAVFLISKLGCKWTIVLAIACNVPYMAAQIHPRAWTLLPSAFLMGLAVAPLWSAKCTYLCVLSEARAALTGRPLSAVRDQLIGLFFMVFLLSMVWGNLVSSLVLSQGEGSERNGTVQMLCGVDYCPNSAAAQENPNLERPPQERITLIICIYIVFMLLGALIAVCYLDSLKRYSEGSRASSATGLSTRGLLTATLALHRRREMLLLIPLSFWLGVDYAFVEAEYTASFVACAWGISNIGYVIICYGVANSALALCTCWIVARLGRRAVLCGAAVLHAALLAGVLAWRPDAQHKALFFVVAALWGAADGHWAVQLNSLYAILFPNMEEAAYSNFRLWQSIGFVVAFSYSHYLCTIYKLYIVIGLLVVGVAGYLGIEYTRPEKARMVDS